MITGDEAAKDDHIHTTRLLELILTVAANVVEDVYDAVADAIPNTRSGQLDRLGKIRQSAADLTALGAACEVIVRRAVHE